MTAAAALKRKSRMRSKSKTRLRLNSALLILLCISMVFYYCVPKTIHQPPVQEQDIRDEEIWMPPPESFTEEVTTLEIKLMMNDTAPGKIDSLDTVITKKDLMTRLFDLYIHVNNPNPEYAKAITLADSIIQRKGNKHSTLYFMNWKRILADYLQLTASKESLEKEMQEALKKAGTLQGFSQKKIKQIDSLTAIIEQQKQALDKLKELDIKIEQQRTKME